jgi:hypothetical protein
LGGAIGKVSAKSGGCAPVLARVFRRRDGGAEVLDLAVVVFIRLGDGCRCMEVAPLVPERAGVKRRAENKVILKNYPGQPK